MEDVANISQLKGVALGVPKQAPLESLMKNLERKLKECGIPFDHTTCGIGFEGEIVATSILFCEWDDMKLFSQAMMMARKLGVPNPARSLNFQRPFDEKGWLVMSRIISDEVEYGDDMEEDNLHAPFLPETEQMIQLFLPDEDIPEIFLALDAVSKLPEPFLRKWRDGKFPHGVMCREDALGDGALHKA